MPSRLWCLAIVLFWLVTLGWFARREILPHFFADAPPMFQIELSDEAMRQSLPVRWSLSRNGAHLAPVNTLVKYHDADDTFSLISDVFRFEALKVMDMSIVVEKFRNIYRVNRKGEIISLATEVAMTIGDEAMNVKISAEVHDGQAIPHCVVKSRWINIEPKIEPIAIGKVGSLNPLHPVTKISGLRVGQRWTMPLVDTLADVQLAALSAAAKQFTGINLGAVSKPSRDTLICEVTGPHVLEWNGLDHECVCVEYRGSEITGKTWVRIVDGWVLRQEARNRNEELVLQRE